MPKKSSHQIAIVGGGVCGLSLGLLLADQQIHTIICEAKPAPHFDNMTAEFDSRIFALNLASIELFKSINIWQTLSRACTYSGMKVWDKTGEDAITFSAKEHLLDALGAMVEQKALLKELYERSRTNPYITLMHEVDIQAIQLESSGVKISSSTHDEVQCDLVVAADGGQSFVRNMLNMPIKKWPYNQKSIVATVEVEGLAPSVAYQRFATDGPLAFLPLPREKWYSIVWTTEVDNAERLLSIDPVAFAAELVSEFGGQITKACLHGQRQGFMLNAQLSNQFALNRCALVGDAAHTIHPLAGQGLNLGLQDCQVLAHYLTKAVKENKSITAYLSHFARARKSESAVMLMVMESFKRSFGSQNHWVTKCRNWGLRWADKRYGLKNKFIEFAAGQPITSLKLNREK